MPQIATGLSQLGNSDTWTPVWRDERSYTVTTNVTKVSRHHELRSGFDFIRLRLNHWQPEVSNPQGALTFSGGVTGTPGYSGVGGWNSYAGFLLGEISSYSKSVQFEELSGGGARRDYAAREDAARTDRDPQSTCPASSHRA
ncbi:MAG: hypothetical protein ABJC89_07990 [Acidobacteriota bacterium]